MFAGPNGSGKSTLKAVLPPERLGVYLNPDELEQEIRATGGLDLRPRGISATANEVTTFFRESAFLHQAGLGAAARQIGWHEQTITFAGIAMNAYFASVAADFLRRKLLAAKISFTLETVMSAPDKVALLEQAQRLGYRTYLYYIATDDPEINISRVRNRVQQGGHAVPEDKIVSRYERSLNLLMPAIAHTNRAYIFDNSTQDKDRTWLAEITEGRILEMKAGQMPAWFKRAVWDKISPPPS
jgi:predicted ABC-type ATPase